MQREMFGSCWRNDCTSDRIGLSPGYKTSNRCNIIIMRVLKRTQHKTESLIYISATRCLTESAAQPWKPVEQLDRNVLTEDSADWQQKQIGSIKIESNN